jgi:dienelactone hydrolase
LDFVAAAGTLELKVGHEALRRRSEIDASRIAVMGFSYGGMTSLLAVYRLIQDAFEVNGLAP